MALTYNPVVYAGKHASEIYAEVLEANNTTAKNLIKFFDNVKDEVILTSMSGDVTFRRYKEDIREADLTAYTDTLAAADQRLRPVKTMSVTLFKMDDLRLTRFGASMAAGANNIESPDFISAVRTYLEPRLGKAFEKTIWGGITMATKAAIAASTTANDSEKAWAAAQTPTAEDVVDGLIAQMIVRNTVSVGGTTLTTSNLKTEFEKLLTAAPSAALGQDDFTTYAPYSVRLMIDMFNTAQTYRGDIFKVVGDQYSYLGKPIEFVPLPENTLIGGRSQEFGAATDLLSDATGFEVGKVNNIGDQMFGKLVVSLCTDLVVPAQKVLYK